MYTDPQNQILFQKSVEYVCRQIPLQELKEFSLLCANELLDSDEDIIRELVCEIEGSVVEIEEHIMTEDEFRMSLRSILAKLPQYCLTWNGSSNILFSEDSFSISSSPSTINLEHEFVG